MGPGRTAFAPEPTVGTRPRLVVVQQPEADIPRWAYAWRNRAGFELDAHPTMPGADPCPGAAAGWSRVVADVAEATSAGAAVLVNRPCWRIPEKPRVVAAVQHLPEDLNVIADAAACAAALDGTVVLVHSTPVSFAERSVGLDSAVSSGLATLEDGLAFLAESPFDVPASAELLRAHPHELVNDKLEANVLVVGGSRPGQPSVLGRVTLGAVRNAPCPVVVTPRR
jgi:nucleotide-binding universal stress UspA family protein